uniref:Fiber protein(gp 28) of the cyanophage P-SCSP1u n=1 Tax=Prochlorococcus phage P-SCSP1u TaxID=2914505 RepID=UPI00295295D8|nr:Chain M, Fiber protein(gp 28) of the cyanophage P-SCSP1u [Prochlorococcus phage P-SCSP1u]8I4M_N Chain N, Fiber protein(gp 28) of the cyanophage P-SCSP1u [Prochlorococcus phage P-SCSP1u]8I4M_O Chain O, Fiber protein(gp 28) of the cyanophage P-SCSP1u [Prochlorococcus phage P-SCSP1u]8I4M_P Chain P, Fiber protein(gp 28) of the cyanophage P-SCSP1u [Prochlorococcus phage P-SCSP1u]8I4M_Q Chain Q, Fiber protein(gp 28) of the cyanophage P-SCSP1u [Prochlorococcus phage P-SCSP1u]8I4M_R Chain R, Fiber 
MAFAQRIITSNSAGDQEFTFTFDYIKEEHIKVFVNFVEKAQGTGSNEFQVITNTTPKKISLNTGLSADNTRVEIRRVSSLSTPLVDFADGSTLTAADLDTAEKQSLFIDQELDDALKQGISIDTSTGVPTLNSQRLSNVSDPVNAQDAVTKAYLERSGSITSTQILNGTIVDADINASAAIAKSKLAALNIVNADVNASAAIAGSKLADASIAYTKIQNVSATNRILGRDSSGAGVIEEITPANLRTMINVEDGATADQSAAEIRTLVESASDSNVFTDADHTKLNAIEASADVTDATNVDAAGAVMNSDTSTAAMQFVIDEDTFGSNLDTKVPTQQSVKAYITATSQPLDSELSQLAGMQSGTASKLADSTALTADIADLNQLDGMAKETSITNSNTKFPTSAAVVNFVANQIAPVGGLEVIADEDSFPATQPVSGVVISISNADGLVINNAGEASNARTVGSGSDNVTIKNFPASLRNQTLAPNLGLLVSSTGASQEYNYHKLLAKETDVLQLSDDINDFNNRYRVENTLPAANDSSNHDGDLVYAKEEKKIYVYSGDYNGTPVGSFGEVQSIGNFFISTLSPAFNGSLQDFTITNAPSNAQQIILSINGVIQKPNSGTSTPSEGFALSGSTIKLAAAPPSGADYFAIVLGSTVNIGTPSNNTVTSSILQNGSVIEAKLGSGAVTRTKLNLVSTSSAPGLEVKGDGSSDGYLQLNCSQNSHGIKLKSPPHSAGQSYTLTFPSNIVSGQFLTTDANGNLSWAAVVTDLVNDTSPQLGGNLDCNDKNILLNDSSGSANNRIRLGASQDFALFHNGTINIIEAVSGDLHLRLNGSEEGIIVKQNGAVELYYDNSKKFHTSSVGATVTGNLFLSGGYINLNDNYSYGMGSGNRAQLYHSGNHQYLLNTVGNMYFQPKSGENGIVIIPDDAVELYHNNVKRLETTSGGVTVSGSVTATGHLFVGANTHYLYFTSTAGYSPRIGNADGGTGVNMTFHTNNTMRMMLQNDGHLRPASNNTYDLGTSSDRWRNVYTNDLNLSNEGGANDVDGTWGSYTIQEGAEDLFLINKRTSKKYKFNLTEVS